MNSSPRAALKIALLASLVALSSLSCEKPREEARAVISEYIVVEAVGAKEAQRDYLVARDRSILDGDLAESRSVLDSREVARIALDEIGEKFEIEIREVEKRDGTLRITADVTRPKPRVLRDTLVGETMKAAKNQEGEGDESVERAALSRIRKVLEKGDFPMETATETFVLRKEKKEWRIDRNLEERKKLETQIDATRKLSIDGEYEQALGRADTIERKIEASKFQALQSDLEQLRVSILSGQAREFTEKGEYEKAIENYRKIIELDPAGPFAPVDAEQARQKLKAVQEQMKKAMRTDAGGDAEESPPDAGSK